MERRIAMKLDEAQVRYTTQEALAVTSADFYFPAVPKPLAVFIDGYPHTKSHQQAKDEVFRAAVRLAGYKVLELPYSGVSQRTLDALYKAIVEELQEMGYSLPEKLSIDRKPSLSEMLSSRS
jgi:very-short-patch-repair endonuclease